MKLILIIGILLISTSSCNRRQNTVVVQDRQGHAGYVRGCGPFPTASQNEQYYTVMLKDTPQTVANKFKISKEQLLQRNKLKESQWQTNINVIVPAENDQNPTD